MLAMAEECPYCGARQVADMRASAIARSNSRTMLVVAASLVVGVALFVGLTYLREGCVETSAWIVAGIAFLLGAVVSLITVWFIRRGGEDRVGRAHRVVAIGSIVYIALAVLGLAVKIIHAVVR